MNGALNDDLLGDIRDAYGSLSSPRWDFVEQHYVKHPYTPLIERLAKVGTAQETTDLNDDVSIALFVDFGCDEGVTVRLSLVGKYGCVSDTSGAFLRRYEMGDDTKLRKVVQLLDESGIAILDPEVLAHRIQFGENAATIYQVLFSADEALP